MSTLGQDWRPPNIGVKLGWPAPMIPEGRYTAVLLDAEVKHGRTRGVPYIRFHLDILDKLPGGVKPEIWSSISGITLQRFPHYYEQFGIPLEPNNEKLKAMRGNKYLISVRHDDFPGYGVFARANLVERLK